VREIGPTAELKLEAVLDGRPGSKEHAGWSAEKQHLQEVFGTMIESPNVTSKGGRMSGPEGCGEQKENCNE